MGKEIERGERERKNGKGDKKIGRVNTGCGQHIMWIGCRQSAGVNIVAGTECVKYLLTGSQK